MKKLSDYLAENERTYHCRVKTVTPLDDEAMAKIEQVIIKYLPIEIGKVEKSIFQRHPLDFPGIANREVYWVDLTLGLPPSSYILQQDIRQALSIPEKFIVVRMDNEPTEIETQRINAVADMELEAAEQNLKPDALLNHGLEYPDANPVDGEEFYGDKYNANLTAYLEKLKSERDSAVFQAANAPFSWLDLDHSEQEPKQDVADYNADVEGAPQSASNRPTGGKGSSGLGAADGNLDDNTKTYRRLYKTADGKSKVLSRTGVAVKKG